MPRPIAKRYVDKAKALLAKEGLPLDDERVNQLAIVLREAKALEKPGTRTQGAFVVVYHEDEFGDVEANVQFEFYDGAGKEKTPSATFAIWLLGMASETLAEQLPDVDDE